MEEEIKKYKSTRRDSKEETRGWSKGKRAGRHETLEGRKKQPKKKISKEASGRRRAENKTTWRRGEKESRGIIDGQYIGRRPSFQGTSW